MARHAQRLLQHVRRLVDHAAPEAARDAELLERFRQQRDEQAFASLVSRHGPMVLRLCRRRLGDAHAAEDAFQATFLVLARKADSLRFPEQLAGWLYGVACRVSREARLRQQKQRLGELPADLANLQPDPLEQLTARELLGVIDEEVSRLPRAYRLPLILCGLEGKSQDEVAQQLGWTPGSVKGRLERGRKRLHERLARRGILPAALAALELVRATAEAQLPASLHRTTVAAALAFAAGAENTASLVALGLARTVLNGLVAPAIVWTLVLALAVSLAGAAALCLPTAGPQPPAAPVELVQPKVAEPARLDLHGDALPAGAAARLGTVRLRAPDSEIAVSADGREVIAVSKDLVVRRFDAATGALRSTRRLPGEAVYERWLAPQGRFLLTWPRLVAGRLEVWDLAGADQPRTIPMVEEFVEAVAFSADGRRLTVASHYEGAMKYRVFTWDWDEGQVQTLWSATLEKEAPIKPSVSVAPDGRRVVACHRDKVVRCWDVAKRTLLWEVPGDETAPMVACFAPDGRTVVTLGPGGAGRPIVFRDAATGRPTGTQKVPAGTIGRPFDYSPDGRFLVYRTPTNELVLAAPGSEEVAVRLAPPRRAAGTAAPNFPPGNLAFLPDGRSVIRRAGALHRWDLPSGRLRYAESEEWGHTEAVTRLVFSPDGRLLASGGQDQTARLWDVATGQPTHTFRKMVLDGMAFTPDGRSLLVGELRKVDENGISVLVRHDVASGRQVGVYQAKDKQFWNAAGQIRVTADGKRVLVPMTAKGNRAESVLGGWDLATGQCLTQAELPLSWNSLLTPDGMRLLAVDQRSGRVGIFAATTGEPLLLFPVAIAPGLVINWRDCELALSPDGRLMAAQLRPWNRQTDERVEDGLHVGDMATGRELFTVALRGPGVFSFSADNRLLAVARRDGVQLWETASGQEVGRVRIPETAPLAPGRPCAEVLALSPDGRTLATGHADSTILLWDATLRGAARPLMAAQAEACWADLTGADAARAYAAVWRLADDPRRAVALLAGRLAPIAPPPAELLQRLLRDLGSDAFAVRQPAERQLRQLGERAEPALREALRQERTIEPKRRTEALLAALSPAGLLSGEALRALRAVHVLEHAGTAEARQLLERVAGGVPTARLTREAAAALARLDQCAGLAP